MSEQNPYQPGQTRESGDGLIWQFPAGLVYLSVALLLAGRTALLLTQAWNQTANAANAATPAEVAGAITGRMKYAVFCAPLFVIGLICLWIGFRKRARRRQQALDSNHYGS